MQEELLTGQIINLFYKVYNALGYGFVESVYHNAMVLELSKTGLAVESEKPIAVYYESKIVGKFAADLLIDNRVIVELKASESILEPHETQLTNYLRSTDIEVGLLLNFGRKPEFKRKLFSNDRKSFCDSEPGSLIKALFS